MKKLRFKKIDAFASDGSAGNPAAVVYLDNMTDLPEEEKLRIAQELKGFVSEVGFVCAGSEVDYELCFYSSEREVAFCGHATIAIMNDLIAGNEALRSRPTLSIATRSDRLEVENRYRDEQSVFISAPPPRISSQKIGVADIAQALSVQKEELHASLPFQIVNGGLETLVVPMRGLEAILAVNPDLETLKEFCLRIGVDIVILYSGEVAFQDSSYRTRVFAPTYGYLEDPATGSGNASFGYYLLEHGMWNGEKLKIEQNGHREAPNAVLILAREDAAGDSRVWFGGGARVRIDGHYVLAD